MSYEPYGSPGQSQHMGSAAGGPLLKTQKRTVTYTAPGDNSEEPGTLVSAQAHSSRSRTVETTTVRILCSLARTTCMNCRVQKEVR